MLRARPVGHGVRQFHPGLGVPAVKYTKDGKPVLSIGKLGPNGGSNDIALLATREVYVADG